jgi:hypothetical protein
VEVANAVLSAALVAVILILAGFGTMDGATYKPDPLMIPTVAFPPATPFTAHVRLLFVEPFTVAVNCCEASTMTLALAGVSVTVTAGVVTGGFDGLDEFEGFRLQPASVSTIAPASTICLL